MEAAASECWCRVDLMQMQNVDSQTQQLVCDVAPSTSGTFCQAAASGKVF